MLGSDGVDAMVQVSSHPLVRDAVARLRDVATAPPQFRALVRRLAGWIFFEAAARLRTASCAVQTPLALAPQAKLADRVGFFPILRAALGMVEPLLEAHPDAVVHHLGLYRDHDTQRPVVYYQKVPERVPIDWAFVLDPMLATGGSAAAAAEMLRQVRNDRGEPLKVVFLGLIGAPQGVAALRSHAPEVYIHLAALDEGLNDLAYIVPGLGDAGDRQFSTGVESVS